MAGSSSYVHPEGLRRYLRGVLQHYLALLFYLAGSEIVVREVLLLGLLYNCLASYRALIVFSETIFYSMTTGGYLRIILRVVLP